MEISSAGPDDIADSLHQSSVIKSAEEPQTP